MIRTILQDTFQLVDGVVANVDLIVSDSVDLAQRVGRGVRGRGTERPAEGDALCGDPRPDAAQRLAPVEAWNEVVLNQPMPCSRCGAALPRGRSAYLGLCADPAVPRAWLCRSAVAALADESPDDDGSGERR